MKQIRTFLDQIGPFLSTFASRKAEIEPQVY
jgi:hypothetical protein